jgi:hypothetical protein
VKYRVGDYVLVKASEAWNCKYRIVRVFESNIVVEYANNHQYSIPIKDVIKKVNKDYPTWERR